MFRPDTTAFDRPLQLNEGRGVELHVWSASYRNFGLGAIGEEVAVLPFGSDFGPHKLFQSRTQDLFAQPLSGPVFGLAFMRSFPISGEQADDCFAARVVFEQLTSPPAADLQTRRRVDIEEDLVGQLGSLGGQPGL